MAYDENLAIRLRELFAPLGDRITEKKMMGGLCFLLEGKMCCGIVKDELMVRVPSAEFEAARNNPHARDMDFTGKPLKGFLFVAPEGFRSDAELEVWVKRGIDFVEKEGPKTSKKKPARKGSPA